MRTTATAFIGSALLLALIGCSAEEPDQKPAAKASNSQPAGLTAKTAAAELADATGVTTLGDPQDNTDSCSSAEGEEPQENDCAALVTTDTVSIYEFETPKVAGHWVKEMPKDADWRQVDRFALAFGARDQALTADERRDELETALGDLVAKQ